MQAVDLLWTSGWDSTFRLLDLVLGKRCPVQPYYVFDRDRGSSPIEIETQDAIRAALAGKDPEAAALIRPTRVFDRHALAEDEEVAEAFRRLKDRSRIGYQYDFLAKLAKSHGLRELELAVHRDDKLFVHLAGKVEETEGVWRVAPDAGEELKHLRYFRFPLLMMTKRQMEEQAGAGGFLDLMQLTWFCHHPVNSRPCGSCNPCKSTIEEGFGWRVPWPRRVRSVLLRPVRPLVRAIREARG